MLHSQHFTVQPSHHALHAAVGVKELTATQLALGLFSIFASFIYHSIRLTKNLVFDFVSSLHLTLSPIINDVVLSMNRKGDDLSQSNLTFGPNTVECTDHMCPLCVHWHVKSNYKDHWRVKLTVSNYNYGRNYTNWNVLVQHPTFSQSAKTFSFNSTVLSTVGVPGTCIYIILHF